MDDDVQTSQTYVYKFEKCVSWWTGWQTDSRKWFITTKMNLINESREKWFSIRILWSKNNSNKYPDDFQTLTWICNLVRNVKSWAIYHYCYTLSNIVVQIWTWASCTLKKCNTLGILLLFPLIGAYYFKNHADFLEGLLVFNQSQEGNNRSVMPLDVLGRTRATLSDSASLNLNRKVWVIFWKSDVMGIDHCNYWSWTRNS